ncbi:hypothetical protein M9Y10_034223 [Tritrichomonas musculus]|uniref:dolichol kinase n=1 Tax=Tritrichomonas musculus TaxID=1915356 RepID=A0ABR2KFB8_9EUKA
MNLEFLDSLTWSICLFFAAALRFRKNDYADVGFLLLHFILSWINQFSNIRKSFRHGAGDGIVCGSLAVTAALGSLEANSFHICIIVSIIIDVLFLLNRNGIPTLDIRFIPIIPLFIIFAIIKVYSITPYSTVNLSSTIMILIIIISVFMSLFVLTILMKYAPSSFTIGECIMVSTLSSLPVFHIFNAEGIQRFSSVFIVSGIICLTLSLLVRKPICIFILVFPLIFSIFDIGEVFHYIFNINRIVLLVYCGIVVVVFLLLSVFWKGLERFPRIVQRKFFHLMAFLVFVPPVLIDYQFLRLCISGAIFLFLFVESLRIVKFPFVYTLISNYVEDFIDERDRGELILTHLFLLLGLGLPVLMARDDIPGGLAIHTCGISVLAVGDAVASIVGVNFGKHKWPGSKKSIEGTIGAFFGTFITLLFVHQFEGASLNIDFSLQTLLCLAIPSLLGALDEAFTSQIDNLTLPFVMIPPILYTYSLFL